MLFQCLKRWSFRTDECKAFYRSTIQVVLLSKDKGIALCRCSLALNVTNQRQAPSLAIGKDSKGCIELSPVGIDEGAHEVTQAYLLTSHIAVADFVIEKANTIAITGVDSTNVIALVTVGRVGNWLCRSTQFVSLEEILQHDEPLVIVELCLKQSFKVVF